MLTSSIGWILIISGIGTAAGGACRTFIASNYSAISAWSEEFRRLDDVPRSALGALLFVVCALTVYSAYVPVSRVPILTASIIEKFAIVALIFFGPLKRTIAMTVMGSWTELWLSCSLPILRAPSALWIQTDRRPKREWLWGYSHEADSCPTGLKHRKIASLATVLPRKVSVSVTSPGRLVGPFFALWLGPNAPTQRSVSLKMSLRDPLLASSVSEALTEPGSRIQRHDMGHL